jgi:CheY-like chemotaxis protein
MQLKALSIRWTAKNVYTTLNWQPKKRFLNTNQQKAVQVVSMTTKTILLIHKDPNIGEVIEACLTDLAGWNVLVATSTSEGLRKARLYQPDAIILEISVGEIDGLLCVKQLRVQPATEGIPVLLLSFKAKRSDLQESWSKKYQVKPVIVNPLDPAMFPIEVAKVLDWGFDC